MTALEADLAAIARIDAVPSILKTIQEATGLRLTLVARVTPDAWVAAAVRDEMSFGLKVEGELDVTTTLCAKVRDTKKAVIIEDVVNDPEYCGHPTPKMYGFSSYISIPLDRKNGVYFGTLCGLDSRPLKLKDDKTVSMMRLFADLLSLQLEADERHETDVAALEDERESAKLREQFIAVLGHDERNPLSSIAIGTDLLAQRLEDPAALRVLDRIHRSTKRIQDLVDDVLDLARRRLGGGIEIETVPVDDIVARAFVTPPPRCMPRTPRAPSSSRSCAPGPCTAIRNGSSSSSRTSSRNAIQHGAEGSPIRVIVDGNDTTFTLAVENRGTPIPEAARARLFQPYFRGGDEKQRTDGALGLGLFIVAEIAKSHRGAVEITSVDDRTTFTPSMPR